MLLVHMCGSAKETAGFLYQLFIIVDAAVWIIYVGLIVWLYAGPHTFSLPWQFRLFSGGKALPGTTTRTRNMDSSGCGEVLTYIVYIRSVELN